MRGTSSEQGIIPLAVADIFRHINSMQDREFLLRVSYMEVRLPGSEEIQLPAVILPPDDMF